MAQINRLITTFTVILGFIDHHVCYLHYYVEYLPYYGWIDEYLKKTPIDLVDIFKVLVE
jgi:hypothetical protein